MDGRLIFARLGDLSHACKPEGKPFVLAAGGNTRKTGELSLVNLGR
jgi:hypothetical protein